MSTQTSMIGTILSGRYRIEARLGSGGMSTVYLARDETLDRAVALKVLHREMSEQAEQLERFRAEARAVAKLSHPNIVAVIDAGEDSGYPYIVFEYVEGETLKQRIARLNRLPVQDALVHGIEISRGLAVAHARHMVHRDVKPQNVLVDPEGRAKVTDFGIARQLEQEGLTQPGRVIGTTDYVSPEQAMGHQVDPRSDIYSLGVVLFEMLTGDVPFHADSLVGVAMKHVNEELPDVQRRRPELSSAAAAVVERSTTKDPGRRYQDVSELVDDLEAALEVEAARAGTEGAATSVLDAVEPRRRRLLSRDRVSWAALGVLGLVIAAALAVVLIAPGTNKPPRPVPLTPVGVAQVGDFAPTNTDSSSVDLAIQNNPSTPWSTDTYATASWGNLRQGVGVWVKATQPAQVRQMQVHTQTPGWQAVVYATSNPSSSTLDPGTSSTTLPPGWGAPVGRVDGAQRDQRIRLRLDQPQRYFLLWITQAAPAASGSGYQVQISNIRLLS